jgi:hypothetical protein
VRQNAAGRWFGDNGGNWTPVVSGNYASFSGRTGWAMADHDVAVIDVAAVIPYLDRLMNLCMALASTRRAAKSAWSAPTRPTRSASSPACGDASCACVRARRSPA